MSNIDNTSKTFSANFVRDRHDDHSIWKALANEVPGSINSIKDHHSLLHNLMLFVPEIGSEGPYKFFGLCSNEPNGTYVCIQTLFIEEIIVPIDVTVLHFESIIKVESTEEFKLLPPSLPAEEAATTKDEAVVVVPI
jgi:hypothetical protein